MARQTQVNRRFQRRLIIGFVVACAVHAVPASAETVKLDLVNEAAKKEKGVTDQVVLIVRFVPKPGQYTAFRDHLFDLVRKMSGEPNWINTIIHDDLDNKGQLVLYETWLGSKERWLRDEPPKPYRADFEARLPELLEKRDVSWLTPIREWSSSR